MGKDPLDGGRLGGDELERFRGLDTAVIGRPREGDSGLVWRHRQDHEALVWADLCDVARRLGLEVRQESLPEEARVQWGLARVGDRRVFVVEIRLPQIRKNLLLAETLRRCDVSGMYMPPYLRELLASKTVSPIGPHVRETE